MKNVATTTGARIRGTRSCVRARISRTVQMTRLSQNSAKKTTRQPNPTCKKVKKLLLLPVVAVLVWITASLVVTMDANVVMRELPLLCLSSHVLSALFLVPIDEVHGAGASGAVVLDRRLPDMVQDHQHGEWLQRERDHAASTRDTGRPCGTASTQPAREAWKALEPNPCPFGVWSVPDKQTRSSPHRACPWGRSSHWSPSSLPPSQTCFPGENGLCPSQPG